jgi:hypothetical protein
VCIENPVRDWGHESRRYKLQVSGSSWWHSFCTYWDICDGLGLVFRAELCANDCMFKPLKWLNLRSVLLSLSFCVWY